MTLRPKLTSTLLAVAVSAILTGCALEGDDGENGLQGEVGQQGIPGENAVTGISLNVLDRSVLGGSGSAEIVQYHSATQTVYATNSDQNVVSVVSLADLKNEINTDPVHTNALPALSSVVLPQDIDSVALDGLTSIAVHGDLLAVAIPAAQKSANGYVVFYSGLDTSAPVLLKTVEVGNLPDMVTFTPDGSKVLVANEGEPSGDYTIDPEGSVAVIDVINGVPADSATLITFDSFNDQKSALQAMGMHFPNPEGRTINGSQITTTVAQDLEPEYIATSNDIAYVSLQENNGVAIIDLASLTVSIQGLGFKDWSEYLIDVQEDGAVSFGQYEGLYGVYMPDTIGLYEWKGASFLLTANEGDAREYFFDAASEAQCLDELGGEDYDEDDGCLSYTDEIKVKKLTAEPGSALERLQVNGEADDLRVTSALGDADGDGEYDAAYTYGARSFSIFDQNGLLVFDSGDDFERITASVHSSQFNNGDDENESDSRSENKGPEPEALTIGSIGEKTYAFIGLERMGGIFVYDITNPYQAEFVEYAINRDLTEGVSEDIGDLAPESLVFIPATDSPIGEPLLVVGNEVSGSVSVWLISQQ